MNKGVGEIGIDAPIAHLVGVGQRAPRDLAPDAHVIEFGFLGAQTGLDVSEALAVGELCKGHTEVLIETREADDFVVSLVALHAPLESLKW